MPPIDPKLLVRIPLEPVICPVDTKVPALVAGPLIATIDVELPKLIGFATVLPVPILITPATVRPTLAPIFISPDVCKFPISTSPVKLVTLFIPDPNISILLQCTEFVPLLILIVLTPLLVPIAMAGSAFVLLVAIVLIKIVPVLVALPITKLLAVDVVFKLLVAIPAVNVSKAVAVSAIVFLKYKLFALASVKSPPEVFGIKSLESNIGTISDGAVYAVIIINIYNYFFRLLYIYNIL